MAGIDIAAIGPLTPVAGNNSTQALQKAASEKTTEAFFLNFLVKEMNLTGLGSVLNGESQMSGDSLLMNQMLQNMLIDSGNDL
ncbi:MAG: hypothetical protein PVH04_12390 [Gammaproteobacteria bacterium]|jgi:Rod binding domain-containing protein